MTFDTSRSTYDPWNDYSAVVMEQGRVQLDSDWNEWLSEISRRIRAGTLDALGRAAYPPTTPYAFQITADASGSVWIGRGRMYVDGVLAENHGDPAAATWDPALAELSGSPQPPPDGSADPDPLNFTAQPYYPGAAVPSGGGAYLAYLDVWTRPVTWLENPALIDKAVGVDTTGRLQTAWQVRFLQVPADSTWTCSTPDSEIPYPPESAGQLTTSVIPNPAAGACCLTDDTGYTGMENQNYLVEIHQAGTGSDTANLDGATFKWSREHASVMTGVTSIASATNTLNQPASQLTVMSLGRDQVLGFSPGDWIEILDDAHELNTGHLPPEPTGSRELHQIDSIDVSSRTITLTTTVSAGYPVGQPAPDSHTRIIRWDQSGKVYLQDGTTVWWDLDSPGSDGSVPVPGPDTTLILESGITVTFALSSATGGFNVADFWSFAARTADGSVDELAAAPPQGIHHHYTKLSIVTFPSGFTDCRTPWPSCGGGADDCGCCCSATVGDGVTSTGKYTSIQAAVNSLLTTGGEVCVLAGQYFENVVIEGAADIVIHGCCWQTRIASQSLSGSASDPATPGGISGMNAVFTVVGSAHIELRSFAVEAAEDEVGILLDRAPAAPPPGQTSAKTTENTAEETAEFATIGDFRPDLADTDVTLHDLVITASGRPAILAVDTTLLRITGNRIAMGNVRSMWPAVSVSGREIHIEHNWVGLQNSLLARAWLPESVIADLVAAEGTSSQTGSFATAASLAALPLALGGIQIAGRAQDVYVIENEIEGGRRNGITLGSLVLLDAKGTQTNTPVGVLTEEEDDCSTTGTLQVPPDGPGGGRFAAGGVLVNIAIERNRIRDMGLCGIGPVGFFDLRQTLEVISIENLTITGNEISSTLLSPVAADDKADGGLGYGAICVPDVTNLVVRDNAITDFGQTPAAAVCGIFILHAEVAEISRNQVRQENAWTSDHEEAGASGVRAGILALAVTPPTLDAAGSGSQWTTASAAAQDALAVPVYQPGLPAVRVEDNVVQVAVGEALEIIGFGPFSVVNNSLSSGGTISLEGTSIALAVLILSLSAAMRANGTASFSGLGRSVGSDQQETDSAPSRAPSSGTVLFTNNICQLETRAGYQGGISSVLVASLDHVLFGDNACWVDGFKPCVAVDALVLARTVQVTSNRFQESGESALGSCLSLGLANITTQNISDNQITVLAPASTQINSQNLIAP